MTKLKIRDESVKAWRNRYPRNFVAPTKLVSNIETVEDEDCFNFRMDFLMCFLAIMVECHGQGRCKEKILGKLTCETEFSKINWCAYIMDSMRGYKKRWKRNDHSVPFSGPLAILTLLYVDSFECKGIKMDKNTNPNRLWNMNRDLENESENDNFRGDVKNDKEEPEGENDNRAGDDQDQQEEPGEVEKQASVETVEEKEDTTKKTQDGNETAKEGKTQEDNTTEYVYDGPPFSIGLTQLGSTQDALDTVGEQENDGSTLHENTREYVYDVPPFSIGLTQLESPERADETKRNLEKRRDAKESSDIRGEKEENVEANRGKVIKTMEEKRRNPIREIGLTIAFKSPYKIRGVNITETITKKEELVWEYLFKEEGMMYKLEPIFRNNFNLEVEKFRFKTLKYDTKVFNKVIDAWVDVLNYEEKYRSPTSPYRLFCNTYLIFDWMLKDKETDWPKCMERFILNMNRVVYWNPALMDLRGIDMVFITMLEHDHYYLMLLRVNDHDDYFEKDPAYKVKDIFVKYLEHVKHSKTDEMIAAKIKKVKISWSTCDVSDFH
ncbi:hypothetical protein L1987_09210 [Smallanthus sonchifolius]|uniref:Uncharacterized protein n=1 Tax=Smallanthus sonchifolius TaxID=185202 RepID=A0ACB9JPA3_9ASTR|nr:hypothetical protein L1987_09210 [Smallanthus sonchifolius]